MSRGGALAARRPGRLLNVQRSDWHAIRPMMRSQPGMTHVASAARNVHDGQLRAIVTIDLGLWHLSVSFIDHKGRPSRYPTWDELADARYQLMPDDITVAMLMPPPGEFVAVHDSTFHIHQIEPPPTESTNP